MTETLTSISTSGASGSRTSGNTCASSGMRGPASGKAADRAHEPSDLLGDHHDLTVLREDAAGRTGLLGDTGATLEELIARRQAELVRDATTLAEKVYAKKPKRFVSRIHGYWDAWR